MTPRRVAIVGAGPKGVFALERLLHHCSALVDAEQFEIDMWDPDPHPGAGPVYRPSQPSYLLMNQPSGQIDMWLPGAAAVPAQRHLPFAAWARSDPDEYAPRAEVGRYLSAGFDLIRRHAPSNARVVLHPQAVTALWPDGTGHWSLRGAAGRGRYHEVLLTTGHNGFVDTAQPPGATVAVRGFALSFIDVALSLTEGRGGRFEREAGPYRLRYVAPPRRSPAIWPFSRTGRPILPKPEPAVAARLPGLRAVEQRGLEALAEVEAPVRLAEDIAPVLARTASACLDLARRAGGPALRPADGPAARMRHALDVAAGATPPDALWAMGHTWRALYPALVRCTGSETLRPADRPAFLRLAAEMERIAFGPAPRNTAKLLALIDAGVVRLDRLTDGPAPDADLVMDAVLPGPGVPASGLLRRLLERGHVQLVDGGRGVRVDADGTCIAADGAPSRGLAAYGRPTEDSVVGNDTLSRTLHPFVDRWAARVARTARGRTLPAERAA